MKSKWQPLFSTIATFSGPSRMVLDWNINRRRASTSPRRFVYCGRISLWDLQTTRVSKSVPWWVGNICGISRFEPLLANRRRLLFGACRELTTLLVYGNGTSLQNAWWTLRGSCELKVPWGFRCWEWNSRGYNRLKSHTQLDFEKTAGGEKFWFSPGSAVSVQEKVVVRLYSL